MPCGTIRSPKHQPKTSEQVFPEEAAALQSLEISRDVLKRLGQIATE